MYPFKNQLIQKLYAHVSLQTLLKLIKKIKKAVCRRFHVLNLYFTVCFKWRNMYVINLNQPTFYYRIKIFCLHFYTTQLRRTSNNIPSLHFLSIFSLLFHWNGLTPFVKFVHFFKNSKIWIRSFYYNLWSGCPGSRNYTLSKSLEVKIKFLMI